MPKEIENINEFQLEIKVEDLVVIDFYADWFVFYIILLFLFQWLLFLGVDHAEILHRLLNH